MRSPPRQSTTISARRRAPWWSVPQDVMVVLGDDEWLARAVAEHERVEGGEQQTGRCVIGGQQVNVARRPRAPGAPV
jgi:hypothetical protein